MLGARIKQRRKTLNLTQAELGKLVGVTKSTISYWEADTTAPNGSNLQSIAKALKCSPEWLLTGSGTPSDVAIETEPVPLLSLSDIPLYLLGSFKPAKSCGHQSILIRESIGSSIKTFALIWDGEGMRPRIEKGDTVYIDPAQKDCGNGVYLFDIGSKKPIYELGTIQETPRGLILHFDNAAPGWEPIPVEASQCVGKVVAFIPSWI